MMETADRLEISKMVSEAVRAAVAVNSNALDTMLADDAALDNKNGFSGGGAGLDDSIPSAASGSQPMPFDLAASVETSQDGTQKRLVVKCVNGQVIWCSPTSTLHQDNTPGVQTDVAPWVTIHTGDWEEEITPGTFAVFLHYKLQLAPQWDTINNPLSFDYANTKIWQKVTVERPSTIDAPPTIYPFGDDGLYYANAPAQVLVAWIPLGAVTVSSGGAVSTSQMFHGNLILSDLLIINGGGGSGTPDQQSSKSGCWKIATVENQGATSQQLQDCYYNVGGITKQAANQAVPDNATGYLCAVFSASGVTVAVYASLGSIQADESKYVVPLYEMDAGEVVLDMRNAPQIQVFEGTL